MIYISAGHNPEAKGACNDGFCEYDEAVLWVEKIIEILADYYEIKAKFVPTGSLKQKVNYINNDPDSDMAVEIHFNSNVNARGSETLYYPKSKKGKRLAKYIQDEFEEQYIFQPNRGVKEGWYHSGSTGTRKLLYFLAKTNPVAVIVEPQFIYHKQDIIDNRCKGCTAIADAIAEYVRAEWT